MKIAILGVGAVGGYFGGRLVEANADVLFIARGRTLTLLESEGLKIKSPSGDAKLTNLKVTGHPADAGGADLIILGVKAWQVEETARSLESLVKENTTILPLQNGVDAPVQLAQIFGEQHVLGGTCRIAAVKTSSNEIRHMDVEPHIALGELDNSRSERVLEVAGQLEKAGIETTIARDIHATMWCKFLFIAPVSGVGAVIRSPVGVIRETPDTRDLLEKAMHEVHAVALGKGIVMPDDIVNKTLDFLDSMDAGTTSSMQRDVMEGRPSELEALNGAVVRMGEALDIETPVNRFIHSSLLPMERKVRR